MIYKEVFAGARIVLPAANVRRRSRRLNDKLVSLLQVCRLCHSEASPILYSNAVMEVARHVAAETVDQGLRNEHFWRIKTVIVDASGLEQTLHGWQLTKFPNLKRVILKTSNGHTLLETAGNEAVQEIVLSQGRKFRALRPHLGFDWLVDRGISTHITFRIWQWTKPITIVSLTVHFQGLQ